MSECTNTQKPNLFFSNGPGWQFLWCISFKGDSLIKRTEAVGVDINFLKNILQSLYLFLLATPLYVQTALICEVTA